MEIDIESAKDIEPLEVARLDNIAPITIATIKKIERIEKIAPAAVHIKELNQIDPLTIESLRVDGVRNLEPLNVDRLNVTHMPMMNLSLARMPAMDVNIGRMPPLAIGLHQEFDLPSNYTIHTRLLGFEIMRFDIHGASRLVPKARARREQSHQHQRSFPDVAAVGNPAIPNRCRETGAETVGRQSQTCAPTPPLSACAPCFAFSLGGALHGRKG